MTSIALRVLLTNYCPESCRHCSFSRVHSDNSEELDPLLLAKCVELISNDHANKITVVLTGGEPTAAKNFIPVMNQLNDSRISKLMLATNGIALYRQKDLFKSVKKFCPDTISLSMETTKEDHDLLRGGAGASGNHQLVSELLKKVKDEMAETETSINSVVFAENLQKVTGFLHGFRQNRLLWKHLDFVRLMRFRRETPSINAAGISEITDDQWTEFQQLIKNDESLKDFNGRYKVYFLDKSHEKRLAIAISPPNKLTISNSNLDQQFVDQFIEVARDCFDVIVEND
ncbi:MAG: radical SAM protein [Oligoflexia bacterium]|nr:radical SAM protein [Oligoflexia bacterium]